MREDHVQFLVCPKCKGDLRLSSITSKQGDSVESGELTCSSCGADYPIIRHIPRFVPLDNYAGSFGLEWSIHARTQYDSYSGCRASEERFFQETKWPRDLTGQLVLEVGSGSGRFTEQAVSTGAMVVSMDYSSAVEANYASNGQSGNVLVVQGDIRNMPFREGAFDKLFCFGVLQHTCDVRESFFTLPRYLKRGGQLAIDVYRKPTGIRFLLCTKYWFRPITKRMNPKLLYGITSRYVRLMWPICRLISRLPRGGNINWLLLVPDYRRAYDLKDEILKEWAVLDIFDMLSPRYDSPQSIETVQGWFEEAKLTNIDVHYGYNGIEGRAGKP